MICVMLHLSDLGSVDKFSVVSMLGFDCFDADDQADIATVLAAAMASMHVANILTVQKDGSAAHGLMDATYTALKSYCPAALELQL